MDTLNSISNMSDLLKSLGSIYNMGHLGRLEEAEPLGAQAVRGAKASFAQSHPFRLAVIGAYGQTLARLHRHGEAEGHLLEAYEGFVKTLRPNHRRTIEAIKSLVELYESWHAVEPDKGYDAKTDEWRAKRPAERRESEAPKEGEEQEPTP